jgi:hypothetical protein
VYARYLLVAVLLTLLGGGIYKLTSSKRSRKLPGADNVVNTATPRGRRSFKSEQQQAIPKATEQVPSPIPKNEYHHDTLHADPHATDVHTADHYAYHVDDGHYAHYDGHISNEHHRDDDLHGTHNRHYDDKHFDPHEHQDTAHHAPVWDDAHHLGDHHDDHDLHHETHDHYQQGHDFHHDDHRDVQHEYVHDGHGDDKDHMDDHLGN